jgi:hypothetical protein
MIGQGQEKHAEQRALQTKPRKQDSKTEIHANNHAKKRKRRESVEKSERCIPKIPDGAKIICMPLDSSPNIELDDIHYPIVLPTCNSIVMSLGRFHRLKDNNWWCSPHRVSTLTRII